MRLIDADNDRAELADAAALDVDAEALRAESVAKVIFPDDGEPWIEREPFAGREDDPALIEAARELLEDAQARHDAPPDVSLDDAKRDKAAGIEADRKAAERQGVTLEGVRYAGDADNRQALREAIEYAEAEGRDTFDAWKTSDGDFIEGHPLAAVKDAYQAIGARRSELIAREGALLAEVEAAEDRDTLEGIEWTAEE